MSDLAMTKKLTKSILKLIDETNVEFSEETDVTNTSEDMMNWLNTMLSAIESSNEFGEDVGFAAIYTGPFKIPKFAVHPSKLKPITEILVNTIQSINLLHENLDVDYELQSNLPIRDLPEEKKNLTVAEWTEKLNKMEKKNKLKRKHWNGHLLSILNMIEDAFNEKNDSDVDSDEL
jgi:hypothetical protein